MFEVRLSQTRKKSVHKISHYEDVSSELEIVTGNNTKSESEGDCVFFEML